MARTVFALIFTIIIAILSSPPVFAAETTKPKTVPTQKTTPQNSSPRNTGGFSITPTIGGYFFTGSAPLATTPLYGVKIGYDIFMESMVNSLGIEGTLNYFSTKSTKDETSATGYLYRIDVLYPLVPGGKWVPFLALGGGKLFLDRNSASEDSFLFNYGAGLKYFLEDYLVLRMDARHLLVYNDIDTSDNYEVGFGVSYLFGKERKKKPEAIPDKDQDGVPDNVDKCLDTPKGAKVDQSGCPADSDKDGVPDIQDKCLNTPPGIKVGKTGCPWDGDRDGVPDHLDKCPDTPPEVETDMDGCPMGTGKPAETAPAPVPAAPPVKPEVSAIPPAPAKPAKVQAPAPAVGAKRAETVPTAKSMAKPEALSAPAPGPVPEPVSPAVPTVSAQPAPAPVPVPSVGTEEAPVRKPIGRKVIKRLNVEFDVDKNNVKAKYHRQLRNFADALKASPDTSARIEGHTDSSGRRSYNYRLSSKRAESVKKMLVRFGADPARISTKGYGPSRPIADNATVEGKRRNRRTVAAIILTIYEPAPGDKPANSPANSPANRKAPKKKRKRVSALTLDDLPEFREANEDGTESGFLARL